MIKPALLFYVPAGDWPSDINRENPVYRWSGERFGKWNWVIQTWKHLNDHGVQCSLTSNISDPGIVFAHRGAIRDDYRPNPSQVLVAILAERKRHPFAQYHVIQDPQQAREFSTTLSSKLDRQLIGQSSCYLRYWPQPNLIPRSISRGARFENVVFKGVERQLDKQLVGEEFRARLKELGLNWQAQFEKTLWCDYRDVDAVVAVRSFRLPEYSRKPATKLYNSWLAGVPAILGPESSFRSEGSLGVDYYEVSSVDQLVKRLRDLAESEALRTEMVDAGKKKAARFTVPRLVSDWSEMISNDILAVYERWTTISSKARAWYFLYRSACPAWRSAISRVVSQVNPYI